MTDQQQKDMQTMRETLEHIAHSTDCTGPNRDHVCWRGVANRELWCPKCLAAYTLENLGK